MGLQQKIQTNPADPIAVIVGAVAAMVATSGLAAQLELTAEQVSGAAGILIVGAAAIRTWVRTKKGTRTWVDPFGVVVGMLVELVTLLGVPSWLGMTPEGVLTIGGSLLAVAAAIRTAATPVASEPGKPGVSGTS